ncbi:MAG: addiction module protein [Pseudomonadota bacterium]
MSTRLQDLPIEARIKLVEDLWDSIAMEEGAIPLTDAQKAELDKRLDAFEADGDFGEPAFATLEAIRHSL